MEVRQVTHGAARQCPTRMLRPGTGAKASPAWKWKTDSDWIPENENGSTNLVGGFNPHEKC